MDRGLAHADWNGFDARAAASKARGRLRGRGLATFLEWTGADVFEEKVSVTVAADGGDRDLLGDAADGPGPRDHVRAARRRRVRRADRRGCACCSATPTAAPASAARARARCSSAARRCASRPSAPCSMRTSSRRRSSRPHPPTSNIATACSRSPAPTAASGLFELAGRQPERRIVLDSTSKVADATWPNGCHVCEVEVDPDTGAVTIDRYASVNDVGRVVNPMIVIGQLEGGAAQGIGQALSERFVYDAETGPGADGELHGLRDPAHADDPPLRHDDGRVDAVPQQPDGREGRRRAGHDRRDAGGGQRGGRCAGARRPR